jgi:hypothetical protein
MLRSVKKALEQLEPNIMRNLAVVEGIVHGVVRLAGLAVVSLFFILMPFYEVYRLIDFLSRNTLS